MTKVNAKLMALLFEHPEARIVTDVSSSMISWGDWRDLVHVRWIPSANVIELEFE